jgi:hypothetical protein
MLLDTLLSTIAPHECLNCSAEGKLLCISCTKLLDSVPEACYRCRKLSDGGKTCKSCRSSSDLFIVRAATIYKGLAKELVWQLKFQGTQAAAREIADQLVTFIPRTPVLTTRKGVRVVEGNGLENRRAGNGTVGSNPTPSAKFCCPPLRTAKLAERGVVKIHLGSASEKRS